MLSPYNIISNSHDT